ncbi:hypothetical protein EOK75_14235 (plasmid) [Pseudorhodobacter turbinis]|uniref:Uncharacterized protein n=1 Tax=Pseudorhodobacter turbinis TaxID=2500533 RepID=A0A4P8EJR7_9RHOB|nr:hypothetical protein [Pseudorhodobacter turbinis]QCO56955.1 hypothetical protein EOK75_14235 [Pseudorhodobacter turbinis]
MSKEKSTADRAADLVSLLKVLSLAVDGEDVAAATLGHVGGGRVLDMASELAFDILGDLERAEMAEKAA